jgi:hypothetical protein
MTFRYRYAKKLADGVSSINIMPLLSSANTDEYISVDDDDVVDKTADTEKDTRGNTPTKPCILVACVYANNLPPVLGMSSVEASVYIETLHASGNISSAVSTQVCQFCWIFDSVVVRL